ncbi:hypothetical protein [Erythrobacter sp.]|jgi:hypothetical protein|uniref:hypothetical protein n=1 Tax=Erythrobacter sp. TaxID=1042 RepID=UPI002EAE42A2|nr:hypothetical protein [Erythrobacter sp.]
MSDKNPARKRDRAKAKASELTEKALERDKLASEFVRPSEQSKRKRSLLAPSPNPATNLVIVDILVRGAARLMRKKLERSVAKAGYGDESKASELVNGRSTATSLGLYGASKLATRSPLGLGMVTSALIAKTLYDRGKSRQARLRSAQDSPLGPEDE